MNKIMIIGRLTKDPEKRMTQNGVNVTTFTVAVDRRFKNADGTRSTDFFRVTAWRALADLCAEYLAKGRMVAVSGELQIHDSESNGKTYRNVDLIADEVQFLSAKEQGGSNAADNDMTPVLDNDDMPF